MMKRMICAAYTDKVTQRELENKETAYRAALEGIVLLKNSGALPVEPGPIALYGAGASMTVKGGTGSGEVNERHVISILEGMEQAGFRITSRRWLEDFERDYQNAFAAWRGGGNLQGLDIINSMAKPFVPPVGRAVSDADIRESACDTAVYVVARQAGEGSDRRLDAGDFELLPAETESIEKIARSYRNSVLVINSGSYMDIGDLDEKVSAVIFFCQQGMEGGRALADILSGRACPSGKLTDTWARHYSDVPCGGDYSRLGDPRRQLYREGIFVGYRYYDSFGVTPRYPFGFGLGYTDFEIKPLGAELSGGTVTVRACVKNTGSFPGRETVQVYVSPPRGRLAKEYQRLAGFEKTGELQPGESAELSISFQLSHMASFDGDGLCWLLERGDYVLRLGSSSANTAPAAVIALDGDAVLSRHEQVCPLREKLEELSPPERERPEELSGLPVLPARSGDIETKRYMYYTPPACRDGEVNAVLDRLTAPEMAELCVGTGLGGMLATGGSFTPGAVGRTTDKLEKKGLVNVNLADGPAGLRLLRESALSQSGKLRFVNRSYMIGALSDLPDALQRLVEAKPAHKRLYQFTSSFPVGTALAQSWNRALCQAVGRAVSREMEEYNVTYWLAPAMNIHRNPLCGRNFEYLSEDPVLTGAIAAAIVRGVQSVPGNYATIKHFACNNSEEDRNHCDSIVGQRALREIYLRGFELCVREAAPAAVMTSYNKLNGVYTPNSYDLCTKLLRNEWGFEGVVMTDWFSTLPGLADAGQALIAGNDLIMPGTALDKLSALSALRSGRLTREALRRAAGNVAKSVLRSASGKD